MYNIVSDYCKSYGNYILVTLIRQFFFTIYNFLYSFLQCILKITFVHISFIYI